MLPMDGFATADPTLWACVRLASETLGYSGRRSTATPALSLRRFEVEELARAFRDCSIDSSQMWNPRRRRPTALGVRLCAYLNARAELLERHVAPLLMDRDRAAEEFERLRRQVRPLCALPMNKQKGAKRHHLYLTGIVNMLVERELGGVHFDAEPRGLTVATKGGRLAGVLSRRMDGAYPSRVDPVSVWEIKEYYGTTTFGSRVADGVYETQLDGLELAELRRRAGIRVLHYLFVDDRFTWWDCGRSYLCRIVDILHMGLVDEVLFGREVLTRWPEVVRGWTG